MPRSITVRLSEGVLIELKQHCERVGNTLSEFVRQATLVALRGGPTAQSGRLEKQIVAIAKRLERLESCMEEMGQKLPVSDEG